LKTAFAFVLCLSAVLCGCAQHKEYEYRDFQVSRENAYQTVKTMLQSEQYDIVEVREENYDAPEIYMESSWNLRDVNKQVYRGNSVRRKAYVRIITVVSDRKRVEFQPLERADKPMTKEEREKWEKEHEESVKKGSLEMTTIGIAIRRERLSDIKSPADIIDGDWVYEGPDQLEGSSLMGKLEMIFADKRGAGNPSDRSLKRERDRIAGSGGK
jgi:hypothetical protein